MRRKRFRIRRNIGKLNINLNRILVKFRKSHNRLRGLSYSESHAAIDKADRFLSIDIKPFPEKDTKKRFTPHFQQLDFVHCHFTGIGFEWDFPHYALVWDINPYFDSVMVIPTTSEIRNF